VLGRARGESEVAARALGVRLQAMEVRALHEFMSAFAAIQLPGVVRIALVGSLATEKPEPKDVDLLIAVTDEADLAATALAAGWLKRYTQSYNHGADVFVADSSGHYLGHLCP
jgi:hypothetical protein